MSVHRRLSVLQEEGPHPWIPVAVGVVLVMVLLFYLVAF